jgi:lipopolysaccharide export LptBFGC system permease protein LptF
MWTIILLKQEVPEGKIEMSYHLFSEFLMAVLCVVSGVLFLLNNRIAKHLNILALGMVIYSVLNAAGYYGEQENVPMLVMFTILFLITTIAVFLNLKSK